MPITAIFFDIGGVLIRTVNRTPREALARQLGMSYEALEELVFGGESGRKAQLGVITNKEQWTYVCRRLNWPLNNWRALRQEFFAGDVVDEELLDYIRGLHRRYKTGLISNAFKNVRRLILGEWGMADVFDTITVSAELGILKPDARIFHAALQSLNVSPGEAVFVDDFLANVEGARAVGMQAIHFLSPSQVRKDLDELLEPCQSRSGFSPTQGQSG